MSTSDEQVIETSAPTDNHASVNRTATSDPVDRVVETFNPILSKERVSAWHRLNPWLTPALGTALVFTGVKRRPVVVWPDDTSDLNTIRWSNYQAMYRIDISTHSFSLDCLLPCQDLACDFIAEARVQYWVDDPVIMVERRITNARATLESLLLRTMRSASRNHDLDQLASAEQAITTAIEKHAKQGGFEVTSFVLKLAIDAEERAHVRQLRQIQRDKVFANGESELLILRDTLDRDRRKQQLEFYSQLTQKGYGQLVLFYLTHHPEDFLKVAELLAQQRRSEREYWLKAVTDLFKSDVLEEFDLQQIRDYVLQHFTEQERQKLTPEHLRDLTSDKSDVPLQQQEVGS